MSLSTVQQRIRQGIDHLRSGGLTESQIDMVRSELTVEQARAFFRLPSADQVHLVCVNQEVISAGSTDPDLRKAALLHDIGKQIDGRPPNLLDRSVFVLLERFAPGLLARLSSERQWWNRGLYVAAHHPRIGAEMARGLGCSESVCNLIARHADEDQGDDHLLAALQRADRAC